MLSPLQAWIEDKTGHGACLNASTLEKWQFERLREQLAYARKHSPYYAKYLTGVDISSISGRSDLSRLPFTTARILREQHQDLLCVSGAQVARVTTLNTSGTGGDAKRVYFSQRDLARTIEFFACGMTSMVKPGQKALICLSDGTPDSLGDLLKRALGRISVQSDIHGAIRDVAQAAQAAAGAHCLIGLPVQLGRLCQCAPHLKPATVLLTADYVPDGIICTIEKIWGSEVFTHYGMTETGFGLAVQCAAHEAYHLRDTEFIVEVIDPESGRDLPDGEWGEIVVTSLLNEAMALIRYRTGDIARRIVAPCTCGGNLPRLDKVQGRAADTASNTASNDKAPYSIQALDEALFRMPGLLDYNAEIMPDKGLCLTLDSRIAYSVEEVKQALQSDGVDPQVMEVRYQALPVFTGQAKRSGMTVDQ